MYLLHKRDIKNLNFTISGVNRDIRINTVHIQQRPSIFCGFLQFRGAFSFVSSIQMPIFCHKKSLIRIHKHANILYSCWDSRQPVLTDYQLDTTHFDPSPTHQVYHVYVVVFLNAYSFLSKPHFDIRTFIIIMAHQ